MGMSNDVNFEELNREETSETNNQEIQDLDPEMTGYMKACAMNLVKEVNHLKKFLQDKDESYILSNPEEVANELAIAGNTAQYFIGGYNVLSGIREHGMVPRIVFLEDILK